MLFSSLNSINFKYNKRGVEGGGGTMCGTMDPLMRIGIPLVTKQQQRLECGPFVRNSTQRSAISSQPLILLNGKIWSHSRPQHGTPPMGPPPPPPPRPQGNFRPGGLGGTNSATYYEGFGGWVFEGLHLIRACNGSVCSTATLGSCHGHCFAGSAGFFFFFFGKWDVVLFVIDGLILFACLRAGSSRFGRVFRFSSPFRDGFSLSRFESVSSRLAVYKKKKKKKKNMIFI